MEDRKHTRLQRFDYAEPGSYFITLCTQNRARLFAIETDGTAHRPFPTVQNALLHKWIRETQNKYSGITIDKYVIMPDHLHFLVSIEQDTGTTISDVMCFFKTMTTNEYIQGVKSGIFPPYDKKLWQKSYYDHVIRNHQDYNEVWEYIENNPQKWLETHNAPP